MYWASGYSRASPVGRSRPPPGLDGVGEVDESRRHELARRRVALRRPLDRLAQASEERLLGAVPLHRPADIEAQDVVRALPHGVDLGVTQDAGHRPLLDVAVATVDLDGIAGCGDAEPGHAELDQRSADAQARAEVTVEHQRLRGLDLDDQLGQLALHQWVVHELAAERLAGLGVAKRFDERSAGAAESHHGDAEPGAVGQLHHAGHAAPVAGRRGAVALGCGVGRRCQEERLGAVELDLGRRHRLRAELVLQPSDPDAVACAVATFAQHEERGDAADAVRRSLRLGEHDERRPVGVGREPLEP